MKVLLVNGSPHPKGCTNRALAEVAAALIEQGIETTSFWIGAKPVQGCIDCRRCETLGQCVFEDKVNTCLHLAAEHDGFVFGAPVHFAGPAGQMTTFLDRLFYAAARSGNDSFRLKPGTAISVARRAGTTATFDRLNKYFGLMQMPIVTSRYWNLVHGMTPEEMEQDVEGLRTMRILGRNMAYLLKCIAAGKQAQVAMPEEEKGKTTNFVRQD